MKERTAEVELANRLVDAGAATPKAQLLAALFDKPAGGKHLVERLRDQNQYPLARDLLALADTADVSAERAELIRQQQALCLYKDPDLPAKGRLDQAFAKLQGKAGLAGSRNPETLGLAGAISRRYWDLDGHRSHLERALRYYEAGHRLFLGDPALALIDRGYAGINAAFLADQLASLGAQSVDGFGGGAEVEALLCARARQIRTEIKERLTRLVAEDQGLAKNWWVVATLIEAHFGLGDFAAATRVFAERAVADVAAWEVESTLRQLVALARLHGHITAETDPASHPARDCLKTILGKHDPKVLLMADQKVGLALSGGGFRASFYEIGVLAALAEFDLLRHVEVISTVSGGSVLGAHYYLELRHRLETKADHEIDRQDYLEIVQKVAKTFLEGVECNIRTRVVLNPLATLRMFFTRWYSRTMRAGELYEEHIYQKASGVSLPITMRSLLIRPAGEPEAGPDGTPKRFNPRAENWRRRAKVPVLVINATSLNTGHNWQFTASWMGEPLVETDVDSNPRLRRMYYDQLKGTPGRRYADLRLGYAVAASACVPGLFEPLALVELYEHTGTRDIGPTTVRLVDGGVHDNQGVSSLLEQDCSVLIVADASGQMPYEREPSAAVLGGVLRSNGAMMARIREAQYRDVKVQREVGRRKALGFVHLKQGLHAKPVNWQGCDEKKDGTEDPSKRDLAQEVTAYGIRKSAQEKLAAIRTDLDSFSEIEAWSLMYSGYCTARAVIPEAVQTLPLCRETKSDWPFLAVAEALQEKEATAGAAKRVEQHLAVGSKGPFKVWHLDPLLKVIRWVILVGGGAALLWWTWDQDVSLLSLDQVWWIAVGAIVTWLLGKWAMRLVRPGQLVTKVATGIALTLVGWLAASIHLLIFDPWFKWVGRVRHLDPAKGPTPPVTRSP